MTEDPSLLGRCPDCRKAISPAYLLIEYEKDDGTADMWAECPGCTEVVKPE